MHKLIHTYIECREKRKNHVNQGMSDSTIEKNISHLSKIVVKQQKQRKAHLWIEPPYIYLHNKSRFKLPKGI